MVEINIILAYNIYMSCLFAGGILVLVLLVPIVTRFFFYKKTHIDTIVLLSPISFIIAIIYVYTFGLGVFQLSILFLSFIILLTNIHSLLLFTNNLVIDFYSIKFCIASILELCILLFVFVAFCFFSPSPDTTLDKIPPTNEENVTSTKKYYTGSAFRGFSERTLLSSPINAVCTTFKPIKTNTKDSPVILYLPDVCVSSNDIYPILFKLAENGYTSLVVDFYAPDIPYFSSFLDSRITRPFIMRCYKYFYPEEFNKASKSFIQKKEIELSSLINIASKNFPDKDFLLLTDGLVENVTHNQDSIISMSLELNGFAALPLTNPLENILLTRTKYSKEYSEKSRLIPETIAQKVSKAMSTFYTQNNVSLLKEKKYDTK